MRIAIDPDLSCDGHGYLLTSESLGGSGLSAMQVSAILLGRGGERTAEGLLRDGVCFPVFFDGDCALDNGTMFVVGDLSEEEQRDWIARIAWKLNVPCGKLLLTSGCDPDILALACSGGQPEKHYVRHMCMSIPPGEYLVEVYAYFASVTVQVFFDDDEEMEAAYRKQRPGHHAYVIRLAPLRETPPMPEHDDGWCGAFEFRPLDS
jgi:hypothetical protein